VIEGGEGVRFVTLALKSVMRNDGDFVDVILIYMYVCVYVCVDGQVLRHIYSAACERTIDNIFLSSFSIDYRF